MLLDRLRRGDAEAFALLFHQYNRRLYRVARAMLCDDAEAEDVVQETYVRALTGVERFRGEAGLSTWLTRIAINEALGRRRRHWPSIASAGSEAVIGEPDGVVLLFGGRPHDDGPEQGAARGEIRRLVESAVERLPEPFINTSGSGGRIARKPWANPRPIWVLIST
jgi:RNA polymerase sigma-70 factor, ECF subfamily